MSMDRLGNISTNGNIELLTATKEFRLLAGGTEKTRLFKTQPQVTALTQNLGLGWVPDDAAQPGKLLHIHSPGGFDFYQLPVGGALRLDVQIGPDGLLAVNSGRIAFPPSQVASSSPNTLDDYEEGTWGPILTGDGGAIGTQTYVTRSGTYIKIGRYVHCIFDVYISDPAVNTSNGNLIMQGIPFTNAPNGYFTAGNLAIVSIPTASAYWYGIRFDPGLWYSYFTFKNALSSVIDGLLSVAPHLVSGMRLAGSFSYLANV